MIQKVAADNLINRFRQISIGNNSEDGSLFMMPHYEARQCALITMDELISVYKEFSELDLPVGYKTWIKDRLEWMIELEGQI